MMCIQRQKHLKRINLVCNFGYGGLKYDSARLGRTLNRLKDLSRISVNLSGRPVECGFKPVLGALSGFRTINELYLRNKGSWLNISSVGKYNTKTRSRAVDMSI